MPRCGCAGSSCTCLVTGGEGVEVAGAGTADNPYVITVTGDVDISGAVQFIDSDTVHFTVTGDGTLAKPYQITADVTMSLDDLTDVDAPAPTTNYVLAWNGTAWVPTPPNTVDPGALSVADPITGDGTASNPLGLDLTTGDSLVGSGTVADPLEVAYAVAYGQVTANVNGGDTTHVAVTFPTGRFSAPPHVVVSATSSIPISRVAGPNLITTTSFQMNLAKAAGAAAGSLSADWIAIQDQQTESFARAGVGGAETDATVTCPTPGCENQGVAIEVVSSFADEETGEPVPVDGFMCGVCGTDLSDTVEPMGS